MTRDFLFIFGVVFVCAFAALVLLSMLFEFVSFVSSEHAPDCPCEECDAWAEEKWNRENGGDDALR
jgi:hypothetical protein